MLAIGASTCWAELPLSPRSYHNAVMEQQRSHKGVAEKTKPSSKVKRQLNVRARFYSKVCVCACVCVPVYTYVYMCVHGCVCMSVYACVCVHMCLCDCSIRVFE